MDLKFPCIFVGYPHRGPFVIRLFRNEHELVDLLMNAENWSRKDYDGIEAVRNDWGEEEEDWPVELRQAIAAGATFPLVYVTTSSGGWVYPADDPAVDEVALALEFLSRDMNNYEILQSPQEVLEFLAQQPRYQSTLEPMLAEMTDGTTTNN